MEPNRRRATRKLVLDGPGRVKEEAKKCDNQAMDDNEAVLAQCRMLETAVDSAEALDVGKKQEGIGSEGAGGSGFTVQVGYSSKAPRMKPSSSASVPAGARQGAPPAGLASPSMMSPSKRRTNIAQLLDEGAAII